MSTPNTRIIDLTLGELLAHITEHVEKITAPLEKRIQNMEQALHQTAPSLDLAQAARYVGKSKAYINIAVRSHHLPFVEIEGGRRYPKLLLDHYLLGGAFSPARQPIPPIRTAEQWETYTKKHAESTGKPIKKNSIQ